jgi:hypothetical protein
MKQCRYVLAVFLLIALVSPATAGIFSKHTKPNPTERVPALVVTVRTDLDEHKRSAAAEELRQYDPTQFAEIVPTLAEVAQRDPKSGVRLEAIQSLAKLRPVSQQAGLALEQAAHDDSMRVRMQARTLFWQYRLAGYRAGKTPEIAAPTNNIHTDEPPLAPAEAPPVTNSERVTLPAAPVVSKPSPPLSEGVSGMASKPYQRPTGISPVGASAKPPQAAVTKGPLRGSAPIHWSPAGAPPKTLPTQPVAVPLDGQMPTTGTVKILEAATRPSPTAPAKSAVAGPRPLPAGPAKPANTGPKPLPPGPEAAPAESHPAPAEKSTKEPPLAPSEDDEGPELAPPN